MNNKQHHQLYEISWRQEYANWPRCQPQVGLQDEEVVDLTEARAVLARIMSL
jgi:hypothetical protein